MYIWAYLYIYLYACRDEMSNEYISKEVIPRISKLMNLLLINDRINKDYNCVHF